MMLITGQLTLMSLLLIATDGRILLMDVPCGNYTVTEVTAPLEYIMATGSQNVTVIHNSTESVSFNNTPCKGEIEIKKLELKLKLGTTPSLEEGG